MAAAGETSLGARAGEAGERAHLLGAVGATAVALPTLLTYNLPPSATFLNQAAAFVGWGVWLIVLAGRGPLRAGVAAQPAVAALLGALGLLAAAALAAPLWSDAPSSLSLSAVATIAAAALVALVAAAVQQAGRGEAAFGAVCTGLVVAGALSAVIAVLQIYAPGWTGNALIADAVDRAGANLRQSNHLSTLALWAMVAVVWFGEAGAIRRLPVQAGLLLLLTAGVVLTASRTGMVGVLLLAAWGLVDRRLAPPRRTMLLLVPVGYLVLWLLTGVLPKGDGSAGAGGELRFAAGTYLASSRFAVWADTLALIAAHPWAGVGFGEFNFAWTLTPFAQRSGEFFDHTHNLPLQFAVELGLPLAALVLALLVWALARAVCNAWRAGKPAEGASAIPTAPAQRAALVLVLMVLLHSLLEYPLWYAYFLLPALFAFGLCLDTPARAREGATARPAPRHVPAAAAARQPRGQDYAAPQAGAPARQQTRPLLLASMLLVAGGFAALYDYMGVVAIFAPPANAQPLAQRIVDGRHSWFFAHHANYAAATVVDHPSEVMAAFRSAPHYLLDARLMIAWAKALNEAGDTERARYIAQRLAEFHNPSATEFFKPCEGTHAPGAALPFQCTPPSRVFKFEDFR